jgi:hypothetical protein
VEKGGRLLQKGTPWVGYNKPGTDVAGTMPMPMMFAVPTSGGSL